MKVVSHPNIIKVLNVFITKTNKLCIVMEYASLGDLNVMIEERFQKLDIWNDDEDSVYLKEEEVMDIFVQICLAVEALHDKNIIHRDIKSHNILLMENGQVKLTDFGIAHVHDS